MRCWGRAAATTTRRSREIPTPPASTGRALHAHGRGDGGPTVLTTQFYFADSFTDRVFAREPYRSDRGRDAFNATDPLYQRDLELTLSKEGGAYSGMITLDIA